jgi:hypothetical protein
LRYAERFDLDIPKDFPLEAIERIHAHLAGRDPQSPEWQEWASAANGLVWRFRASDEHGAALIESLRASGAPPSEERYRQEKWLFAFFVEGLSAIECLYYGLYFLGALADPQKFDATIDRKLVTPGLVTASFETAFPSEFSTALKAVESGEELNLWRHVRNVLTHRRAPPRHHSLGEPSLWGLSEAASRLLDPEQLGERREELAAAVFAIAEAAAPFVEGHVPLRADAFEPVADEREA